MKHLQDNELLCETLLKLLAIFPSPAGMSLTKLSQPWIINYFPPGKVWLLTFRLGAGKSLPFFTATLQTKLAGHTQKKQSNFYMFTSKESLFFDWLVCQQNINFVSVVESVSAHPLHQKSCSKSPTSWSDVKGQFIVSHDGLLCSSREWNNFLTGLMNFFTSYGSRKIFLSLMIRILKLFRYLLLGIAQHAFCPERQYKNSNLPS